jgi:DNA-binding transcriptional ArsR family regulator
MLGPPASLDDLFRALSDPTRRRIIEQLRAGPVSTSTLAAKADMALPSFLAHLESLERCGLVRSMKLGRIRMYRLVPQRLAPARTWLGRQRLAGAKPAR